MRFVGANKSFLLGVLTSLIVLMAITNYVNNLNKKFDELALGAETQVKFARHNGVSIHCNSEDMGDCLEGYHGSLAAKNLFLWLGNSQLHAVNQLKSGEKTGSKILAESLLDTTQNYPITISDPNASLQEHLIIFIKVNEYYPVDTLILPLVFDDTRDVSLRPSISPMLEDDSVSEVLKATDHGKSILHAYTSTKEIPSLESEVVVTTQELVENAVNAELENVSSFWGSRGNIRAFIFSLSYNFRNSLLGINASTTRPKIPAAYKRNMGSLRLLLQYAKENNIQVLSYVAPIRGDVKIPYDPTEYSDFKSEAENMAIEFGASFENYEDVVPGELWGYKESTNLSGEPELDFMHFQAAGHAILSKTILSGLERLNTGDNK